MANMQSEYKLTGSGELIDGGTLVSTHFDVEPVAGSGGVVQIDWEQITWGAISLTTSDHLVVSMEEARQLRDELDELISREVK